jgi:hypothetical protein
VIATVASGYVTQAVDAEQVIHGGDLRRTVALVENKITGWVDESLPSSSVRPMRDAPGARWRLASPTFALHVVLTSRLGDMSRSIRHQVYRHRFHSRQRIACRTDKRPHIGRSVRYSRARCARGGFPLVDR